PGPDGKIRMAVAGVGDGKDGLVLASLPGVLPPGDYVLGAVPDGLNPENLALGWADGAYRFTRYRKNKDAARRLVMVAGADADDIDRQAEAISWLRDLVNTPAN